MGNPESLYQFTGSEIAIIGMACRFPGAKDVDTFWQNLCAGVESITTLTDEELLASGVDPTEFGHPNYVKTAPILENVEFFDAAFFGYSPLETEITDPQQRIFLECAWEALEHAGYNPEMYEGEIGVYAGSRSNTYVFNIFSDPELFKSLGVFQVAIKNDLASLATGVSYKLNLRGPSCGIHTACSTSLVAVHLARQSLLIDECQIALAGGSTVNVPHKVGYLYEEGSILSPDGHVRAFDAQAQGTIFGSGVGVVVLKRLEDALADGDYIYAIIKGSAINNDGWSKATFTAPSVDGQAGVIIDALLDAEVSPETVSYVEAHATGTSLGDPIEVHALSKAFRAFTQKKGFCAVGSVKTNIGHLDAAAGMPALIKTALALKHRQIPPSLHFQTPNPRVDFAGSPFYVNTTLSEWKTEEGAPRRAGVSSFGFGGTNAHIILEEAPPLEPSGKSRPWQLLALSARTDTALETVTSNLADHLKQHLTDNLADVAHTLQVGRKPFDHRRVLVCRNHDEAIAALEQRDPERVFTDVPQLSDRPVIFMFSGQRAQYVRMGYGLYQEEPLFREQVDRCCELLEPHLGLDLHTVLYPGKDQAETATQQLNQTALTQPALFVIEYALAQLWMAWGVQPQAMIGHSIGEYVAACLAGVLSLEDALALVAVRGRLMQSLPPGAMLVVPLPDTEICPLLGEDLSLAAINAPTRCVVSGPTEAVEDLERRLAEQDLPCRRLHTSHAFHSPMMDPVLEKFIAEVMSVDLQPPQIPYLSNVTGTWMTQEDATDPNYWARHLRQTVRFADGVGELMSEPARVLLEVGPGKTLVTLARKHPSRPTALMSLPHPKDRHVEDGAFMLTALGRLWLAGVSVDWSVLSGDERRQRLPLPTYPFERQRYWIEPAGVAAPESHRPTTLKKTPQVADWLYRPVWKQSALPETDAPKVLAEREACWLMFQDNCGVGDRLAQRLERAGHRVVIVQPGEQFDRVDEHTYTLNPHQRDDYDALIENLRELNETPTGVVHLWNVTPDDDASLGNDAFARIQDRGFYSLLFLIQAWGSAPLQITTISNRAWVVSDGDLPCPAKATVLGPCLVIPQEHLSVTCRSVDIVLPENGAPPEADLLDSLLTELAAHPPEKMAAYRGPDRWVQQFEPISFDQPMTDTPGLREGGVYLITGGLGNIGLLLSKYLARAVQAKLVLTGRTVPPPRAEWDEWLATHAEDDGISAKIRRVRALEALGAEVLVISADVADLDQMRAVVARAGERFGAIHGVIHCAGLTREESFHSIRETDRAEVESHFQSKAYGLFALEQVLQGRTLDFCLLQSSLASILGGLSYVAYSAANLFMDAFALQQRQRTGLDWISVNWDSWHYAESGISDGAVGATLVELAITPPEGIEAFRRVLALADPRVVVSTSDLQARIDQWVKLEALRGAAAAQQPGGLLSPDNLPPRAELERRITAIWQKVLGVPRVGLQDNFFDLGGDSLSGMQLISKMKRELNVQVEPVTLFEAPTVGALVRYLRPEDTPLASAGLARQPLRSQLDTEQSAIAIVGMSGRFPGAHDLATFWQNLCDGVESITLFSDEELRAAGVDPALLEDPDYVKARPILDGVELFDAAFFGYTPREAELMDPQHRVFLECAWEALEHAGYDPERYSGAIGVYAGATHSTYLLNLYLNASLIETIDPLQMVIGNVNDSLTTSVSYKLNLKGPSVAVQTFCSTSLVAVHMACQSLLRGECDITLAGGVTILLPQISGYQYQEGSIVSPDGHVRTFDARAQGTVFGNGAGVVVLKRLADALADGNHIHAVIKGSAINNDGSLKIGYTAPSVEGQAEVIATAQAAAGVTPDTISYVEAHGTGTSLGDPVEITALNKAFRAGGADGTGFCAIGSLKTNVGHLDRAAGVAALIKATLALEHRQIPPSLHFESPNPKIDFASSPFYVNTELREWSADGTPRRAGVSALGFGGTNAHVIVEEAPEVEPSGEACPWQLLVLSARTSTALERMTANLAAYLKQHPEVNLADVAYTMQVGRREFGHRRVVICQDQTDALAALETLTPPQVLTGYQEPRDRPVAFMFTGQGAQYVQMGRELYGEIPLFQEQVDQCCELLEPHLGLDLRAVLYPSAEETEEASQRLQETVLTQPALFVIEYALAQLWQSWGVRPQALIGHSVGEYVAACLAGVFSLEDGLALVAARGRLMQELPGGAMLAIPRPEVEVQSLLDTENSGLSLAAVNGPERCVVSGPTDAIEALEIRLTAQGTSCRRLHTSHAFHSAMMDPILEQFAAQVKKIQMNSPQIPYLSNVTGTWITAKEATDPDYWAHHLRQTVRFADGVRELLQEPERVLLEVGPGQMLSTLARKHSARTEGITIVSSLPHTKDQQSDLAFTLNALGRLWLAGIPIDWDGLHAHEYRRRVPLPTYPFERQRCWIEPSTAAVAGGQRLVRRAKKANLADWFYVPSWKRSLLPEQREPTDFPRSWLVFTDANGVGEGIARQLRQAGRDVALVLPGEQFRLVETGTYTLNPRHRGDYNALLAELHSAGDPPGAILHLWSMSVNRSDQPGSTGLDGVQDLGFYSLIFLAQALDRQSVTDPLQLWVVTDHLHEVNGEEALCPEKATVLGPIRTIPYEYPHIVCRNIDLAASPARVEELIRQVMAEITAEPTDLVVAYRGNRRWLPIIEAMPSADDAECAASLRSDGVYLVTGGLGDTAYRFTEYLAQLSSAKLVLVEPTSLPERTEWEQWLSAEDEVTSFPSLNLQGGSQLSGSLLPVVLAEEQDSMNRLSDQIEERLWIEKLPAEMESIADELCTSYLCEYLKSNGVEIQKGTTYSKEALRRRLRILTRYEKLYEFMLSVLAADGIATMAGDKIEFVKDAREVTPSTGLRDELRRRYPEAEEGFQALEHCVEHYHQVLIGETDGVSVLYPGGSSHMVHAIEENQLRFSNLRACRALAAEILARIAEKASGRKLKILEVGAGDGYLTWEVTTALEGHDLEYYFTDMGSSFVLNAEKQAAQANLGFMKFDTLDISRDPAEQGFEKYSFDIILADGAIHTTRSIRTTLENLKKLLAPNGLLFILEATRAQRWASLVWGLLDGWWNFADEGIRQYSPLLDLEKWTKLLAKQAFHDVYIYPRYKDAVADYAMLIAQQPVEIDTPDYVNWVAEIIQKEKRFVQTRLERIQALEALGGETLVVCADVADEQQMQAVLAQAHERFGEIQGVIHTAVSVPPFSPRGEKAIQAVERAECDRYFGANALGLPVLNEVLQEEPLDFALALSAQSSFSGKPGGATDLAVQFFSDTFAGQSHQANAIRWTSVDWDIREDVQASAEDRQVFQRIFTLGAIPQVLVSPHYLEVEADQWNKIKAHREAKVTAYGARHPRPDLPNAYIAPRNEMEQTIVNIWEEVLGIDQVGIHDNFLDLGGDSLMATQLVSRLRAALQLDLPLRKIFEAPTAASLAETITVMQADQEEQAALEILAQLDQLSEEEITAEIQKRTSTLKDSAST